MVKKCAWISNDPFLEYYHDKEWGRPLKDDNALFELLILEIFQAGLSWKTVLYKRDAFKKAFANFDIEKVSKFTKKDFNRLINDKNIIRNRQKITATLENAKIIRNIQKVHKSFYNYLKKLPDNNLPALQKVFKKTFKFTGPEITRMFAMAISKIPPEHDKDCFLYKK